MLANTVANHHENYQTLIKNGTANGAGSNAYLTMSYVPAKTKCINMKYRTGTLYNQKHARAHTDTQSMPENTQQHDEPPSKRTHSQCPSRCNTCPDNMPPHQIPDTPPTQQLPFSAPAVHTTLSCSSQSSKPKQNSNRILQLNTNMECPVPRTQPLDSTSMANALSTANQLSCILCGDGNLI